MVVCGSRDVIPKELGGLSNTVSSAEVWLADTTFMYLCCLHIGVSRSESGRNAMGTVESGMNNADGDM